MQVLEFIVERETLHYPDEAILAFFSLYII